MNKRKISTYAKYKNVCRLHLEGILGACLLSGIPNQEIQKKISDHLSRSRLSDSIKKVSVVSRTRFCSSQPEMISLTAEIIELLKI